MLVALSTVSVAISSPVKGREICQLGLWKGPKGLTDEFYGFIKCGSRKFYSIFVIDSYLKDGAFTAVKTDPKF